MNTGGARSFTQVTVRETVAVLPHPSIALKVLTCVLLQPDELMLPSDDVTVGVPHASVAVAVPRAASIAAEVGLQPIFCGV